MEKNDICKNDDNSVDTSEDITVNSNQSNTYDISAEDQSIVKREHTRSRLALLFIMGFFAVVFLSFMYATVVKSSISELKEFLTSIIGAFSGLLGFIIGYYYKEAQKK